MKFVKFLIVASPILLQIALFAALYTYRSSAAASTSRPPEHVDICDLHRQRDRIAAQLSALEHKPKQFLPRGVTPTSSDSPHTDSRNN